MRHNPQNAARILSEAGAIMASPDPDDIKLRRLWGTVGALHACALANDLRTILGTKVYGGPFKGMELTPDVLVGLYAPRLLGCYEFELHEVVEHAIGENYTRVLNIGCSFGYYSVGMALRMPGARVDSFDIDPDARQKCAAMAALNNLSDRVSVSGEFRGEDFAKYLNEKTLVFIDVEGAELDLLDPAKYPALKMLDIIVEMHDLFNPQISKVLRDRFAASHDFEFIMNRPMVFDFAPILGKDAYVDPFDALLVTWETRDGPTPWGVLRTKVR